MKKKITLLFFLLFSLSVFAGVRISKDEVIKIGYKIYKNECGNNPKNLTHWNTGERFASLGIGHFLWYPLGVKQSHAGTFPKMLTYMQRSGVKLPSWLANNYQNCPWRTKAEFDRAENTPQMQNLRTFLSQTMYYQTLFIINRFNDSIPALVSAADKRGTRANVEKQLYRIVKSPLGLYVLIDYANFKGTGTYGGDWGLLQVLELMRGNTPGNMANYEFAKCAAYVLKRRVLKAKNIKQEKKWYIGWIKRLETYYN